MGSVVKIGEVPANRKTWLGRNCPSRIDKTVPDAQIEAYFARIGHLGAKSATLQTLRALHALHPAAIAFENLDVLLKRPIALAPEAVAAKLVHGGRGGYCYEQNTLFLTVLRALGFAASAIGARGLWSVADARTPARPHMLLLVRLAEGRFLADVGYGRLTLNEPLRLEPDVEQPTTHGAYRLVCSNDEFQLQTLLAGTWRALYQLSLQEQTPAEWEVANRYTSTHPDSIFTKSLMAARSVGESRYALLDNRFRVYRGDGSIEQSTIATPEYLGSVLRNDFKINLPQGCEKVLTRAVGAPRK
jgi:N-hydroxyarylamine O-acetyltransferase